VGIRILPCKNSAAEILLGFFWGGEEPCIFTSSNKYMPALSFFVEVYMAAIKSVTHDTAAYVVWWHGMLPPK